MITVYHATEFGNNEKPYKKVALIDTFSFQHAYRKTQNIDEAWSEDNLRSTSEGDVLVLDEGLDTEITYFLVPMGNGRRGDKMYDNWGETEEINYFNPDGFIYQGETTQCQK
tara:strand:+ start:218 stop:553 length:336 start_codon:yes stop_codon:yes gene_type:complete